LIICSIFNLYGARDRCRTLANVSGLPILQKSVCKKYSQIFAVL
jgi:hypothetical protein